MKIINTPGMMRVALLLSATALACAAPSQVSNSPATATTVNSNNSSQIGSKEDGLVSVTFKTVYKPGPTKDSVIALSSVKEAPPFPTGYSVYKNMVYRLETEAIFSGTTIATFKIASASADDFKNLRILHLEFDETSPTSYSWKDATVMPGKWRENEYPIIAKEKYDRLLPDAETKTIAATVSRLGIFVIAQQNETPSPTNKSFTEINVSTTKSPEPVMAGGEILYTIVVTNKGPKAAGEVNLQKFIDNETDFLSVRTTQGSCQKSSIDDFTINCHLDALPVGTSATVTIGARVRSNPSQGTAPKKLLSTVYLVFKEQPSDLKNKINTLTQDVSAIMLPQSQ